MKVKCLPYSGDTDEIGIEGELITSNKDVIFIPTINRYGPNLMRIQFPNINICSADDDNCIFITGLINTDSDNYKKINWSFYPILK